MKSFTVFFLGLVLVTTLLLPFHADAALVQCGYDVNRDGVVATTELCGSCNLFQLPGNIVTFLLFPSSFNNNIPLVPIIATLLFVTGGLYILFGAVSPNAQKQGKQLLTSVAIGLVIVYSSWALLNTVLTLIGVAEWTGLSQWWMISCA